MEHLYCFILLSCEISRVASTRVRVSHHMYLPVACRFRSIVMRTPGPQAPNVSTRLRTLSTRSNRQTDKTCVEPYVYFLFHGSKYSWGGAMAARTSCNPGVASSSLAGVIIRNLSLRRCCYNPWSLTASLLLQRRRVAQV